MADRVGGAVGVGDRPVQHRNRVEAFQVRRVRQDQVGVGDHLRGIRIGVDDARDLVLAARVLVGEPADRLGGVHRRVPAHVRHEHQQRVDLVWIAGPGVADHRMHHAVCRQRVRPRERMVDPARIAVGVDQQVFGCVHEAQRRGVERAVRLAGLAGAVRRRDGLRKRRLVAERTRAVDRAEQQLQQVQCAAGVEAIAVRADAAHRVHRHRAADHLAVFAAVGVGPRDRQRDRMVERGLGEFPRNPADRVGGDTAAFADGIGRVLRIEVAFGDEVERRHCGAAVGERVFADHGRRDIDGVGEGLCSSHCGRRGFCSLPFAQRRGGLGRSCVWAGRITRRRSNPLPTSPCLRKGRGRCGRPIPAQRAPFGVAREQAVVGATGIADYQPMRIGVAHQIIEVDAIGLEQFMDQREREQPVAAGTDADPLVGDRAITAAHRVDDDDLGAARLELAQAELDRIGVVVLGHAPHHEDARVFPVGLAEFPERTAERVQPARRHVDRAEAAVGGVVDRAELLRPPAGQRLALVAAGEERELVGIARADRREPAGRDPQCLVPLDFLELAFAAFAHAQQRLVQPRR